MAMQDPAEFGALCRRKGLVARKEVDMFSQLQEARTMLGLPGLGLVDFRAELHDAGFQQVGPFWLTNETPAAEDEDE
jgi:hypothetical protein